jgi:hypothetical protein
MSCNSKHNYIFHPSFSRLRNIGVLFWAFILGAAYIRGVFVTTVWSDDYPIMIREDHDISTPLIDGRPLFALLQFLSFSLIDGSPERLLILRAISLSTLFSLFIVVCKYLEIRSRSEQLIIALGLCLPSFQWFVYWATIWSWPIPLLLSTLAWMLWKQSRKHQLLAVLLLTSAILIYPLNSLLPFALLAVKATLNRTQIRELWKEFFNCSKLYGISICISAISILFVFSVKGVSPSGKVSTFVQPSEVMDKVVWWVTRPFTTAFRPFLIDSPSVVFAFFSVIPVGLVVFVGLFHQSLELKEKPLTRIFTVLFFAAIPISPLLIVSQNQIDFRLLASWNFSIFLIVAFFINTHFRKYRYARLPIFLIVTSFVLLQSNQNFIRTFENPYLNKNTFLMSSLKNCNSTHEILVIVPKNKWPSLPLLGNFSTVTDLAHPWVLESNVEIIMKQISPNLFPSPRFVYQDEEAINPRDEHDCTIDLSQFILSISN